MQVVKIIPYKSFKDKLRITKEYDRIAKMEIIDNKYVYVEIKEVAIWTETINVINALKER